MYERGGIGLPRRDARATGRRAWDDCFVNHRPVTLHYDRSAATAVTVTSDCDHWVVYDQPAHATCVEPQSGPPDALNVAPVLVTAGSATRPDDDHRLALTCGVGPAAGITQG